MHSYLAHDIPATVQEISAAHNSEQGVLEWFQTVWAENPQPLAAEVWVFSRDFRRVLVVAHRWRGLVPPGGRVEVWETLRQGAARELAEEAGLALDLAERPAFAAARSYRADWLPTLNVAYWTTADPDSLLVPEPGQPAKWVEVDSDWRTFHPQDASIMMRFAADMRAKFSPIGGPSV